MIKTLSTKEKLLKAAKDLFWTLGYSNVSVRDITGAAGVDAALVSRYFGGKQELFEATLTDIGPWEALEADREDVLEAVVASFSPPFDPKADKANPFSMLLANIIDPEMGDTVRELVQTQMADKLAEKLAVGPDGKQAHEHAALMLAALFGIALMRKNFQLKVFNDKSLDEIRAQIHHLTEAALNFEM